LAEVLSAQFPCARFFAEPHQQLLRTFAITRFLSLVPRPVFKADVNQAFEASDEISIIMSYYPQSPLPSDMVLHLRALSLIPARAKLFTVRQRLDKAFVILNISNNGVVLFLVDKGFVQY